MINTGGIETRGDDSIGIFAQSVGGGGGAGGASAIGERTGKSSAKASVNLNLNLGGNGGDGREGGNVNVTNSGSIKTGGIASHGIMAQSIGGSGATAITHILSNQTSEVSKTSEV